MAGCRWFRDPRRSDIQGELPGWPPARSTPRPTADHAARRTRRASAFGIPLIANLVADIEGASGSPFGSGPAIRQARGPRERGRRLPRPLGPPPAPSPGPLPSGIVLVEAAFR
ncbi:predicted protein [Streptomyces viridochromogenes DSM 40736]|uniref:Predicted protein n=1 Tax=Streptomyces viridochromogenes (strain DSM 40736 / JCM 4977 / BCRC 1201 / Tue 494) TaxID=591159 RepID=D9X740_STRVT|nr:predicted protein [Streptomyces viridochromogenes DSM 40736]